MKSRCSRSAARSSGLFLLSRNGDLRLLTPAIPATPINRSTVQCATSWPRRRRWATNFRRPYSDSGEPFSPWRVSSSSASDTVLGDGPVDLACR